MTIDCFCDYDAPEFYRKEIRIARKAHRCYECGGAILPGEKFECVAGMWEGDFSTFKTCGRCCDIRQWVKNNVPCFCWAHGNLNEDASEAIADAHDRARDETIGLRFGFLRRIVSRDKLNGERRKAGMA